MNLIGAYMRGIGMRSYVIVLIFSLILISVLSSGVMAFSSDETQILIVVPSSGYDEEVLSAIENISLSYGIPVSLVSTRNEITGDGGNTNAINLTVADVSSPGFEGDNIALVIIGGSGCLELSEDTGLLDLIRKWNQKGVLISAIGEGPLVLAKSGILANISATVRYSDQNIDIMKSCGANYLDSPGVLTDHIITARSSEDATVFAQAVLRQVISQQIAQSTGVIYLGDTPANLSAYVIPEHLSGREVHAFRNNTLLTDWDHRPYPVNMSDNIVIRSGYQDWVISCNPNTQACVLYEPFSGISIPYGSLQTIRSDLLGDRRDFSTTSGRVSDLFPDSTLRDFFRAAPEVEASNLSLEEWTDDMNSTNKTISDCVGALFDDISLKTPIWDGLTATVCIVGSGIDHGTLDIRTVKDDAQTSLLYSGGVITADSCSTLLLSQDALPGTQGFVVLIGDDDSVIADLKIVLPVRS
ncbi:MAG TPA: DJ-1/PfpI family protein [Methanospirillum sp.]|nr:DJ-1/PfpI family protein [Methanospirillum sp.]